MKKKFLFATAFLTGIFTVTNVYALDLEFNSVKDITETGYTASGYQTVTGDSKDNNVTTTFEIEENELMVIDREKGGESRPEGYDDATWFGIGVKAPTALPSADNACWKIGTSACTPAVKDGQEDDYTLWIPFKADELKEAVAATGEDAVVTKEIKIYWNGETEEDSAQTVYVNLHAKNVELTIDPDASGAVEESAKFVEEDREAAIKVYEESIERREEPNAETADINLTLYLSLIAISTLGLGYTLKKRFTNSK